MILKAFSLYDMKSGLFAAPFFMPHVGQAIRACQDIGADLSTVVGRHPADYMLCELGTYDDNTGTFENALTHHATVANLLEPRAAQGGLFGRDAGAAASPEPIVAHPGKDL